VQNSIKTIGVIGGGQLARMSAHAAQQLGYQVVVLDSDLHCPASQVTPFIIGGRHDDIEALRKLASACDVMTLENEWVIPEQIAQIEREGCEVYPTSKTLSLLVDKLIQRQTLQNAGAPGPRAIPLCDIEDAKRIARDWGYPIVLKARCGGYDGYGVRIAHSDRQLEELWPSNSSNWFAEEFVPFTRELAVMAARGRDRKTVVYPVVESVQTSDGNRCDTVSAPAPNLSDALAKAAQAAAIQAVEAVDGIGLFGVELFETTGGRIMINEMAPRPHNSGHYTMDCCKTSQFEQHIRSICGLPLGPTALLAGGGAMANLLGAQNGDFLAACGVEKALREVPGAHIHWYGKEKTKEGRKMGHINVLADSPEDALEQAVRARNFFWRE